MNDSKAIEAAQRALDEVLLQRNDVTVFGTHDAIKEAITTYLAAMKAEGFVMVPVEATDKICEAGLFANDNALLMGADCTDMRNAYRAMIAASTQHDDGGE